MKYTEEEIREACKKLAFYAMHGDDLIRELKEQEVKRYTHFPAKDTHVHDFTDNDTITVRELRAAFKRSIGYPGAWTDDTFLSDISEHRENFCRDSVVQDPEGNIWKLRVNRWHIFGSSLNVSYNTPRRPLKLLAVDKRRG